MNLTSERLKYREFREEDFPLFYSVFSNEKIMRYAWIDKTETEEEAMAQFRKYLSTDDHKPSVNNTYAFAVFTREEERFIGFADIELYVSNSRVGCGEIGYFILPGFWGRGYATETARALIEFGFMRLNLHKVCARCNSNNSASENIMKKAGMRKEGELRKVRFKNGSWDDEKHYGILVDEWKAMKNDTLTD